MSPSIPLSLSVFLFVSLSHYCVYFIRMCICLTLNSKPYIYIIRPFVYDLVAKKNGAAGEAVPAIVPPSIPPSIPLAETTSTIVDGGPAGAVVTKRKGPKTNWKLYCTVPFYTAGPAANSTSKFLSPFPRERGEE